MPVRRFSGRVIGVLAAYLVALQALILPLSMPPSAAFAGSLCISETGAPAQHPADHDQGCPCCAGCGMQCCAPAVADLPTLLPEAPQAYVTVAVVPARSEPAPRVAIRTPQMPRGPPAA